MSETKTPAPKAENTMLNLGFNIAAPTVILLYGKDILLWAKLVEESNKSVTTWVFLIALIFPLLYGVYDFVSRKKWNAFSIIGVISVVLTGGIGLFELSKEWMIVKETAVPLVLGLIVLFTAKTKKPFVNLVVMNENVVDLERVNQALIERNSKDDFDLRLRKATYLIAFTFLISAVLNFILAYCIFKSPAGTDEFNSEVGFMTMLSWPVIVLPTTVVMIFIMIKIFNAIKECAGLELEDALAPHLRSQQKS